MLVDSDRDSVAAVDPRETTGERRRVDALSSGGQARGEVLAQLLCPDDECRTHQRRDEVRAEHGHAGRGVVV